MIVFSLLLILVAVTLLVLGFTGGSSSLLIASIVASLFAAIALVISARRSAAARRSATAGADPVDLVPPDVDHAPLDVDLDLGADPGRSEPATASRASHRRAADAPPPAGAGAQQTGPGGSDHAEAAAYAASGRDAEGAADGAGNRDAEGVAYADSDRDGESAAYAAGRRDIDDAHGAEAGVSPAAGAAAGRDDGSGISDGSGLSEEYGSGLSEEFGEADPDDPDDEPLPQAIRPTDAVRVAALDAEVLVVDGRPRYHLADCAHLLGRLTEPLPVSEAVELGFNPCGLCRPVDRLIAPATRR